MENANSTLSPEEVKRTLMIAVDFLKRVIRSEEV